MADSNASSSAAATSLAQAPANGRLIARPAGAPVVVADVGGTQCRLALARGVADDVSLERVRVMPTPGGDFTDALRAYLDDVGCPRPAAVAVAAAGRVRRLPGRSWVALTNTQLVIERESMATLTDGGVWLANDLAAVAAALPLLGPDQLVAFGPERSVRHDLRLVVGVGTGFGAAALTVDNSVIETEGGHADLAAVSTQERQWLDHMAPLGRLTVEQVLSGPGLLRLYEAVSGTPCPDSQDWLRRLGADDPAVTRTLEVFSSWLGRVAGNLVLTFGAWGGVFLTGGVIGGVSGMLDVQVFRRSFEDKAPFSADLRAVPVNRILHPQPALLGMARMALVR